MWGAARSRRLQEGPRIRRRLSVSLKKPQVPNREERHEPHTPGALSCFWTGNGKFAVDDTNSAHLTEIFVHTILVSISYWHVKFDAMT